MATVRLKAWTFLALSVALVVLAGLKAAGVQGVITQDGRSLSHHEGWYQSRRIVQAFVVSVLALVGIAPLLPGIGERIPFVGTQPVSVHALGLLPVLRLRPGAHGLVALRR